MIKNKKGQTGFSIGDLSGIGITLVIAAVVIGLGATIVTNIQTSGRGTAFNATNSGTWTTAYNASGYGLSGLNTLGSYIPTVALVAVAAVVIGVVMVFFNNRQ